MDELHLQAGKWLLCQSEALVLTLFVAFQSSDCQTEKKKRGFLQK